MRPSAAPPSIPRGSAAALAAAGALVAALAAAPHARADAPCAAPWTPGRVEAYFAAWRDLRAPDGCSLDGVSTDPVELRATFARGGAALAPVVLAETRCVGVAAGEAHGRYVARVPAETRAACPDTVRALLATLDAEVPPPRPAPSPAPFSRLDRAFAALAALAAALVAAACARAAARARPWERLAVLATFAAALAVRLAVPGSLANWYTDVLPSVGAAPFERFGPGVYVFHAALRALVPYDDTTLLRAGAVLGAVGVAAAVAWARVAGVGALAALAFAALLVVSPCHVRVAASPSEHALAATAILLCLALHRAPGRLAFAAALALVPVASFVRPDAWIAVAAVPLLDRAAGPLRPGAVARTLAFATVWGATGVAVARWVVADAHHPAPAAADLGRTARHLLTQLPTFAAQPPGWLSSAAVLLAAVGAVALGVRSPRRLLAALAALAVSFVPLGRTLEHDGLLGARYFLVALALVLFVAAEGAATLASLAGRLASSPLVAPAVVAAIVLVATLQARPAWAYRYAFQDEYGVLRGALGALPPGCTVWQLPVRDPRYGRDLDGCLDVEHSPLTIAYPALRFETWSGDDRDLPRPVACEAVYRGACCGLVATDDVRSAHATAAATLDAGCAAVARLGALEPIVEAEVTPHATWNLWDAHPPRVSLARWRR